MSKFFGYGGLPLKDEPVSSARVDTDGNVFVSGWDELVKKVDKLVGMVEALEKALHHELGCSGGITQPNQPGVWLYPCKCGFREGRLITLDALYAAVEAWVKYSKNVQLSLAADYYSDAVRLTKTAGLWPEG